MSDETCPVCGKEYSNSHVVKNYLLFEGRDTAPSGWNSCFTYNGETSTFTAYDHFHTVGDAE